MGTLSGDNNRFHVMVCHVLLTFPKQFLVGTPRTPFPCMDPRHFPSTNPSRAHPATSHATSQHFSQQPPPIKISKHFSQAADALSFPSGVPHQMSEIFLLPHATFRPPHGIAPCNLQPTLKKRVKNYQGTKRFHAKGICDMWSPAGCCDCALGMCGAPAVEGAAPCNPSTQRVR